MSVEGHGYTIAEIDKAAERAAKAVSEFPDGVANAATVQFFTELYLGAINSKVELEKSLSATN